MHKIRFSCDGWEAWGLDRQPLIRDGMPVLIDEDLVFEEEGRERPTVIANRWLRELPSSGAPAQRSWEVYADVLKQWLEFFQARSLDPFGDRAALSAYAGYRLTGPLKVGKVRVRLGPTTWNLHTGSSGYAVSSAARRGSPRYPPPTPAGTGPMTSRVASRITAR
jgi:hypothetical protein